MKLGTQCDNLTGPSLVICLLYDAKLCWSGCVSSLCTHACDDHKVYFVQAHVHQLAVAAGDVYVRMYDRRMLSLGTL